MGNWTPQRFARTVAERQRKSGDGDGLMLWLSSDAMARLRVGGTGRSIGYVEDLSEHLGALEELVEEHVCGPEDKPIRRAPKVYRVA